MRKDSLVILFAFLPGLFGVAANKEGPGSVNTAISSYAQADLQSQFVTARLYLPDSQQGYYRGTRFDWSGLISRVESAGHSFFCEFKQQHDPLNHDDICGTAEEFGIEAPPSFSQAKPGDPFIKIGIGVLERPDNSEYAFWKRYKMRMAGDWKVEHSSNRISFQQTLQGPNGWSYDYTKILETPADAPTLKIRRRLKNTGTQTIQTDHYDHNFLRIDNVPAGTNYALEFRFEPRLTPDSRPEGCVVVKNHALVFAKDPPPEVGIWVRMEGFQKPEDNEIKIVNHRTGEALTMTTDRPLRKLVFYSSGGVLCPEAFVQVLVPPGQTQEWTTTYRFTAENP